MCDINCIICNTQCINLLNLSTHPIGFNQDNYILYFSDDKQINKSIFFNYCPNCFHCQLQKENVLYQNIYKDKVIKIIDQDQTYQQQDPTHLIINETNIDNLLNYKSGYNKIIFYKIFDKIENVLEILKKSKEMLNANGEIIIINSCSINVVFNKQFELINPDLISIFSTNSMKTLCEQVGLSICVIEDNIYYLSHKNKNEIGLSNDVIKNFYYEIERELYNDKAFILFNIHGLYLRSKIQKKLLKLNIERFTNNENKQIIGYGIVNKNVINLINFLELTNDHIDYFISFDIESDIYVPGTNIPIKNYWEIISQSLSQSYIINFTRERLNDKTTNFLNNLYPNFILIDI